MLLVLVVMGKMIMSLLQAPCLTWIDMLPKGGKIPSGLFAKFGRQRVSMHFLASLQFFMVGYGWKVLYGFLDLCI